MNHPFPVLFQTRHRIVSWVDSNKLKPTPLKISINRANRRANYLFISLLHYVRTKIFLLFYLIRISFEVSWSSENARILTLVLVYCRSQTVLLGQILITRSGFSLHCFYCKLKNITIITYTSNQNMIPPSIDRKSINQSVLIGKAILQNDNGIEKSFNETNAPEKPSVLSETEFIYLFIYLTDVGRLLSDIT